MVKPLIIIDPGHGGNDSGALGLKNLVEKDLVLDISRKIKKKLKSKNLNVLMTREKDTTVSFLERKKHIKPKCLFISIHANAFNDKNVNGFEIYYCNDKSYNLAQSILFEMYNLELINRGIKQLCFDLLEHDQPGVLIEIGFITGNSDSKKFIQNNFKNKVSDTICQGIIKYLASQD